LYSLFTDNFPIQLGVIIEPEPVS